MWWNNSKAQIETQLNKAKAIRDDLGDLDLDFEDIFSFSDIKVLLTFKFWWYFNFCDI